MTSLSTFVTRLSEDYVRDPRHTVRNEATKKRAINKWYTRVQQDIWWGDSSSDTLYEVTSTSGTELYALPSDFVRLKQITINGNPLSKTTRTQTRETILDNWTPRAYYLYAWSFGLYPTPDAALPIKMEYSSHLPTLTDVVDSELGDEVDDAITLYAAYMLFLWVRDQEGASLMRSAYEDEINRVRLQLLFNDYDVQFWMSR